MNTRKFLHSLVLSLLATSLLLAQAAPVAPPVAPDLGVLDQYVRTLQYVELEKALGPLPASAEKDYFSGILANREGRLSESIVLLEKALPEVRKTSPQRAAVGLEALGDDYVKQFRYAEAYRAYDDLIQHFEPYIEKALLNDAKDDYSTFRLLQNAPPQAVASEGAVELKTHRDPTLDTIETELTINGVKESWILDTGANFSVVTDSMARRLKLQLLPGEGQTQGITGAENKLRIALLPELVLSGTTLRNVVLLVLEDKNLDLQLSKDSHIQINAILGYPVMQALGRVTFTRDGRFLADPKTSSDAEGAPLLMHKLTPMLQCKVEGKDALFSFDSGATSSQFSSRYYREFPEQFRDLGKSPYAFAGAGGVKRVDVFRLPAPRLQVGTATVTLKKVAVLPEMGTSMDVSYGNLGRDLTDQFESFTLDFRSMRFVLGKATNPIR